MTVGCVWFDVYAVALSTQHDKYLSNKNCFNLIKWYCMCVCAPSISTFFFFSTFSLTSLVRSLNDLDDIDQIVWISPWKNKDEPGDDGFNKNWRRGKKKNYL